MTKVIKRGISASFAGPIIRMAIVSVLMLHCCLVLRAQDKVTHVKVLFPFNSAVVLENYQGNADALSVINDVFLTRQPLEGITITSYSSPEGNIAYNRNLALRRAKSMQAYLEGKYPYLQGKITLRSGEESWEELRSLVKSDARLGEGTRNAILSIIDKDIEADAKERELTTLPEYKDLYANYFKSLRFAAIEFRIKNFTSEIHAATQTEAPADTTAATEPKDTATVVPVVPVVPVAPVVPIVPEVTEDVKSEAKNYNTLVALKTNLLYDAVTALNYQVEFPLGKRFSLVWEHYFPWWATKKDLKYCLQYLTLGGEARWWFAPRPRPETPDRVRRDVLVGHYIGAYGLWGKVDFQWQRSLGMYQCYPVVSAGLTYGYVMPVSKHLNLEFSVSAGYARIPYQHYIPSEDWQTLWRDHDDVGVTHYFGPTKVTVTLVWPLLVHYKVKHSETR